MAEKVIKKVNPYARTDGYIDKGLDYSNDEKVIYGRVKTHKTTGPDDTDFILGEKTVVVNTINLQDKVDAQRKECDIYGIIEKCEIIKDPHYMAQFGCGAETGGNLVGLPDNTVDALNLAKRGEATYNQLPSDLKQNGKKGVATMTEADVNAYIDKKVAEAFAAQKVNNPAPGGDK